MAAPALAILVAVAAVYDLGWRRIPNWLVILGLIAGLALNPWRLSLGGLGLALLVYLPFYLLRAMGAGDVKLMMAVGSLTGPRDWLVIFIVTSLLGGVVALFMMAFRFRILETLDNVALILRRLSRFRAPWKDSPQLDVRSPQSLRLPHGAVIAAATLLFLLYRS